ncbi:transmembrane protein 260-like, partial [Lingula anatina]|uniref:Transmembrane protein 260-like n=1 Tax=Lingula anatina TaxID=7574 RepID=A0A1S3JFV6_LINAN
MGSKKRKETHKKEKEESKKATKDFKNTEGEKGGRSGKNNVKPVEAAPRVRADPDTDQRSEFTIITACGTLIWVVYLYTLHPSLPGGDSGELIVAAHELGVPHPPGYPLFTMISKLAISLLPVGNVAYRAHILNASVAAAAAVLLQLTVFRLTRSHPAAILSAGLFALSPLTWSWATTAEVFSLNNFFIALLMLLSVQFEQSPVQLKPKVAVVGAFVCGLSLCNQHTIAVYVMLIVFWVMYSLASYKLLSLILCVKLGVGFLLGLLPYIYLPLSAYWNTARYTWGDQRTWGGFVRHLLRQEYGTFDLGKDQVGSDMYTFLSFYLDHTITSFLYIGPTLALVGIVVSFKRAWKNEGGSVLTFFLMSLCYTLFFAWRANLNLANPLFKGVVERFWLQTDVVLAVLAGVGFNTITSYLSSKLPPMNTVSTSGAFIISIAVALTQLQVNFHQCNQSGNHVVHDFALNVLSSFPQNSVIFLKGDLPSISI